MGIAIATDTRNFEELLAEEGLGELGAPAERLMDPFLLERQPCTKLVALRPRRKRRGLNPTEREALYFVRLAERRPLIT